MVSGRPLKQLPVAFSFVGRHQVSPERGLVKYVVGWHLVVNRLAFHRTVALPADLNRWIEEFWAYFVVDWQLDKVGEFSYCWVGFALALAATHLEVPG